MGEAMALITIRIERKASTQGPARSRRWPVPAAIAAAVAGIVGVAGASPTTSTSDVAFIPLTVPHKVLSNTTIAANKTTSAVVIGGSTTVPSDATSVQLTVSAKGTKAGTLNFYPTGNLAGSSGQTLSYPAGNGLVSTTIHENVGESGKLTVANAGAGSAVVTATISGYSTQVTAGDVNGVGGSGGQLLTNNGAGGASWTTQGQAYLSQGNSPGSLPNFFVVVDQLTLPAGPYFLHADIQGSSLAAGLVECAFVGPWMGPFYLGTKDIALGTFSPNRYYGSGEIATLITIGAGTVYLECDGLNLSGSNAVVSDTFVAMQVNSAHGVPSH
jgi:hypothetical protein